MRRLLYLAALSMVIGLVFAPVALAQSRGPSGADGTYNCEDFDDQGQAQQVFNQDLSDPHGLDADGDGQACEELPTVTQEGTIPGEGEAVSPGSEPTQVSCSGFASQFGAQQYYDYNATPEEQAILDPNGDGLACTGGDVFTAADDQYTAVEEPTPVEPVLPDTGGATPLLLPAAGLLLCAGLIGMRLVRRS